jgi:hypothetical protein
LNENADILEQCITVIWKIKNVQNALFSLKGNVYVEKKLLETFLVHEFKAPVVQKLARKNYHVFIHVLVSVIPMIVFQSPVSKNAASNENAAISVATTVTAMANATNPIFANNQSR